MKKFSARLICFSAIYLLTASVALAQNALVKVTVNCPGISDKGGDSVRNYVSYLAGNGLVKVNSGVSMQELFQGPVLLGVNIPSDLVVSGYNNSGVTYNPFNGAVICQYTSANGFDPFSISYLMTNAYNGTVVSSDSAEIHIKFPVC